MCSSDLDVALPNHTPVQITPQVDQRLVAIAHALAVHHPLLGQVDGQRQTRFNQGSEKLATKHLGQQNIENTGSFPISLPIRILLHNPAHG